MSEENDDNWEMPKPVFRSSSGSLPKTFEETISQSFSPDTDTVEIDEDDDILSIMETPPADGSPDIAAEESSDEPAKNESEPSKATPKAKVRALPSKTPTKRGGFGSFLVIFLLIALVAAAIVAGLFYYFNYFTKTGNGTF